MLPLILKYWTYNELIPFCSRNKIVNLFQKDNITVTKREKKDILYKSTV